MDDSQDPTQPATQTVLDPRRVGKQNSGFSDEDISDIICLLLPQTDNARDEIARIAKESPQYVVGSGDADTLDLDYSIEDDPERFGADPPTLGNLAIALRLSAKVKSPLQGFTFGRNATRCDFVLVNDPCRRLSNVHFRIYINEYGVLMIEDQSTNGTIVDHQLLKARTKTPHHVMHTLNSGSRISLLSHTDSKDVAFLVRVPRREGDYEAAYRRNLIAYRQGLNQLAQDHEQTITAGPGGHVDLWPYNQPRRPKTQVARPALVDERTDDNTDRVSRDWMGSDRYNRIGPIGKGAFAIVHKVTAKFDGKPYAAKELDKKRFMKNGVLDQKVDNEMNIMQQITHPNIVRYVEHFEWEDRLLIIIMEYVKGGDLGHLVESHGPMSEEMVKVMARQLLEALSYLHGKNITHRDVKPDNILIESRYPLVVKLTDFGLSKMVENDETFLRTFCGTLLYCAPEVYSEYGEYDEYGRRNPRNKKMRQPRGQRYDHAVDIWSLGGVLFYCLTGKPPFPVAKGTSYTELLCQIMTHGVDVTPLLLKNISQDGSHFIQKMLQRRPEQRSTVDELLEHPWLCGRPVSRSEAISDEALQLKASQLSLVENRQTMLEPLSDDEILDDEDDFDDMKFLQDSQKENMTIGAAPHPPRLFGEVNVSAIGSSGVIPEDRLNLPLSNTSFGQPEHASESEIEDSFESQFSPIPGPQGSQPRSSGHKSGNKSHSVDELNNLTFDVSSQSLGGAESILGNLHMKSAPATEQRSFNDFNTSKRKPSFDTSDQHGDLLTADKPTFKRLRSEGRIEAIRDIDADDDDLLYTQVPAISRERSARQIDNPVHKSLYWTPGDTRSYHLRYPEMTQLQHEAFVRGATARHEEFRPGKSALWNLAMKYFPPAGSSNSGRPADLTDDDPFDPPGEMEPHDFPSTLPSGATLQWKYPSVILGSRTAAPPSSREFPKPVAVLESAPGSAIPGLLISVTESTTSWGRGPKNTRVYHERNDTRISKCAFKILLWKEGLDPSKDIRPWNRPTVSDEMSFHFYISTKATEGIRINDIQLRSNDPQNASSASKFWIKLFDGDVVTVWRNMDHRGPSGKLVFRCTWGGSSQPRPEASHGDLPPPPLVPDAISRRLDDACLKTEKRLAEQTEQDLQMAEANVDAEERRKNIDRERRRSDVFEARRAQACKAVSARLSSQQH